MRLLFTAILFFVSVPGFAGFEQASAAFDSGNYSFALNEFKSLAESGDVRSQYQIGSMYMFGTGVEKDYTQALIWYRKAADNGHGNAQYFLGMMYFKGQGVEQDYQQALIWSRKSAEQGDADAQYLLGAMYAKGIGVQRDYLQSYIWLYAASSNGNSNAAIGRDKISKFMTAQEIEVAEKQSQSYVNASISNNSASLSNIDLDIARAYLDGDYEKLFKHAYEKAKTGDVISMYNLGNLYFLGKGIDKNRVEAYKWYEKAANHGHVQAQESMGAGYFTGVDIEQNYIKSYYWYEKAGNQNSLGAQQILGSMCFNGFGIISDYSKARKWWQVAADAGSQWAADRVKLLDAVESGSQDAFDKLAFKPKN